MQCKQCNQSFEVTDGDRKFYDHISPVFGGKKYTISEPTLCPTCRIQRRMAYRNEHSLYKRTCSLTGKPMISAFSPDKPYTVYSRDAWRSDKWEALDYGRNFDFNRPFFDQFFELLKEVPILGILQQQEIVNSEYCNAVSNAKNCYLIFSASFNEDCYYSMSINSSKNCIDCYNAQKCELCYECIDCYDSFDLFFSQECKNCSDSMFLRNCTGCRHCLFCTNLRNKEYYLLNKKVGKEEFEKYFKKIHSNSRLQTYLAEYQKILFQTFIPSFFGANNENVLGNYLDNCRNVHQGFECNDVEDGRYINAVTSVKDVMDYSYWGRGCELIYEVQATGFNCMNIRFTNKCWEENDDLMYCDHCHYSKHLFGCVGLKHKDYCVFNKQYSKEEYEKLVPKIIEHMMKTPYPSTGSGSSQSSEWGEFFPIQKCYFGYNETLANDFFPVTREEALKRDWPWYDEPESAKEKPTDYQAPDDIRDVKKDILEQVMVCEKSKKPYKIITQELKFYREHNLPIPRRNWFQRHLDRLAKRGTHILHDRKCNKCGKDIQTTRPLDQPEKVYCEECYLKEVY